MTPADLFALCDELEALWRALPPPPYREKRQDDTACMSTYVLVANDGTRVACLDCNAHEGDCAHMPEAVQKFLSRTAYVLPRLLAELRGRQAKEEET